MRPSSQFGFSREQRLRRKPQITSVLARGQSTGGSDMRLYSMPSAKGPRFGVIAGRRAWPRAVDRNRFRRLARECFRLLQRSLQQRDFVLRALSAQRGGPRSIEMKKLLALWCNNKRGTQV